MKPCDGKIYRKGHAVFITHSIPSKQIEKWVKKVAKKSGQKVDWYFEGGRAVVLALGNAKQLGKVEDAIAELMPEHDKLMAAAVGSELANVCHGRLT